MEKKLNKKGKKIFQNKWVEYIIIPFLLLVFWVSLSILFNSYASISVLTYPEDIRVDSIPKHDKEIHKGESVTGSFIAKDDRLGIVSIRFNTFIRINDDILIFKIKEKGATNWYYENVYRVDQFQPDDFFTFGFPIIKDSKGKEYEYSLTSTLGESKNAVAISPIEPVVVTKYQFTKKELLADKNLFIPHFWKKFLNSFSSVDFFVSSLVYLFPFVLYVLWHYPLRPFLIFFSGRFPRFKYIIKFHLVVALILGIIVVNIIFVRELSSQIGTLILVISWVIIARKYSFKSTTTFLFAIVFLILIPIFSLFGQDEIAERSATWLYYFIIIGILQQYIINKSERKLLGS